MLKLPLLISEGCVLQQGEKTRIYGWCDPWEQVTVRILGQTQKTQGSTEGRWEVICSGLPCGGPYAMEITAGTRERIRLSQVYVGEVWVTSGQSNMELPVRRVADQYPEELFGGTIPFIRLFTVREQYDFQGPRMDFEEGEWKGSSPETIPEFSAFSYFFAFFLWEKRKVPIGIINSSVGGSPIEAWMGRSALQDDPEKIETADRYRDEGYRKQQSMEMEERQQRWRDALDEKERKHPDTGPWQTMVLPGFFKERGLADFSGILYLRKKLNLPHLMEGKPASLWLGTLVDSDKTYVNGYLAGETGYQYPPRKYQIPEGILKAGENEILIRLVCRNGGGRVTPGKEMRLFNGQASIDVSGIWQMRVGCRCQPAPEEDFIRRRPTGLYHAMMAPCQCYSVRGVVWYQGESNDRRAWEYEGLLKRLIGSFRTQWGQEELPFIIIQLPGFSIDLPDRGSGWPEIREAQSHAGSLDGTAVTVNLDLGEDNDLHPLRKREVAYRAALAAEGMVYKEPAAWKSPVMKSWRTEERTTGSQKQVRVFFDDGDGQGLMTKDGETPGEFWLAGADREFHPAAARITGSQVVLFSEAVREPVAVRYGWCNAPCHGLLYNHSGLPAHPFRTDCWQEGEHHGTRTKE